MHPPRVPVSVQKTESLAIRGPVAVLGAVVGIIAGGLIMPSSCEFTEAQAARLHVTLPLALPLALVAVATWLGRFLVPRPGQRRLGWVMITLAMVLLGELVFTFAAGLVYKVDEPGSFLMAWMFLWPLLAALVPLIYWIVIAARAAERTWPHSLAGDVARRQRWLPVLAAPGALATGVFARHDRAVSWLASVAWMIALVAVPAIAALLILDSRAARRLERAVAGTVPREARESPPLDQLIHLGVGDELRGPPDDAAHPYRLEGFAPSVIGDPAGARRVIARACAIDSLVLAVALVFAVACGLVLARLPAPADVTKTPAVPLLGGC